MNIMIVTQKKIVKKWPKYIVKREKLNGENNIFDRIF